LSDRYAAAKALTYFESPKTKKALIETIQDENEHIYVKLEAAASLARFNVELGFKYIEECLAENDYAQNILESVIVLAEIKSSKSVKFRAEC